MVPVDCPMGVPLRISSWLPANYSRDRLDLLFGLGDAGQGMLEEDVASLIRLPNGDFDGLGM
jgi:hypothetical protein